MRNSPTLLKSNRKIPFTSQKCEPARHLLPLSKIAFYSRKPASALRRNVIPSTLYCRMFIGQLFIFPAMKLWRTSRKCGVATFTEQIVRFSGRNTVRGKTHETYCDSLIRAAMDGITICPGKVPTPLPADIFQIWTVSVPVLPEGRLLHPTPRGRACRQPPSGP